jgi:hypothetical protein
VIFCLLDSEILIKSPQYERSIKVPWVHDLCELLALLPDSDPNAVFARYSDQPGHVIGNDINKIRMHFDHEPRYHFQYKVEPSDHEAAARVADCLYRYAGSVFADE